MSGLVVDSDLITIAGVDHPITAVRPIARRVSGGAWAGRLTLAATVKRGSTETPIALMPPYVVQAELQPGADQYDMPRKQWQTFTKDADTVYEIMLQDYLA